MNNFNKQRHYWFEARAERVVQFQQVSAYSVTLSGEREEKGQRAPGRCWVQPPTRPDCPALHAFTLLLPPPVSGQLVLLCLVGAPGKQVFRSDSDHPPPPPPVCPGHISVITVGFSASTFVVCPHHTLELTCFWTPVFAVRLNGHVCPDGSLVALDGSQ